MRHADPAEPRAVPAPLSGETLAVADVDARGLAGDRWYAVRDDDGHFASGKSTRRFRRRDGVFAYSASTRPDGGVVVTSAGSSWPVGAPELDQHLTAALGVPVRVAPEGAVADQDQGQVSLVGTVDPGGRWLKALAAERDLHLAVYATSSGRARSPSGTCSPLTAGPRTDVAAPQRQPSCGATCATTFSMTWAL